ncbi:MAG: circularly permuted type 2 ATP-grasp protein [Chloroflexi bacterium]|nr:circularly permuted type 2 ATP-grasp protein [Chloroflexota bacterium]
MTSSSELLMNYETLQGPDEMFAPDGTIRPAYARFADRLIDWSSETIEDRQQRADIDLLNSGITFTVYRDDEGTERIFPFSLIPRIIAAAEWETIQVGLTQRVRALNAFLADIYHDQRCVSDGVIPGPILFEASGYNLRMVGFPPPLGVYVHIAGSDLIRDQQGQFRVLEDNVRTPSGVSYVLENRRIMLNAVPDLFEHAVAPVSDYPERLLDMLIDVRPDNISRDDARAVVLSPGAFNSAYFEHSFLAQQMGIPLVEGRDLIVHDNLVYLRETTGLERIHVIYRRVDDEFLDPLAFRPDSVLGVAGLVDAYRAGNVTLVNALGTGVADDKVIYRFVPDFIRYYLNEEPILPNIDTYVGALEADLEFMCANLGDLVVKPASASGGYGIVIGPQATDAELKTLEASVRADPRDWIAQPLQEFSTIPTYQQGRLRARRADLRPFALTGSSTWVVPGGLTRVALIEGSYVVNSSQGGGSKDTWILRAEADVPDLPLDELETIAESGD